jgi:hypothetical protein
LLLIEQRFAPTAWAQMTDARPTTARLRAAGIYTSGTSTQTYRFIPFTAKGCEFWVFRFWVSRHRFDLTLGPPWMTLGQTSVVEISGGIDFTGEANGA